MPRETIAARKLRVREILKRLRRDYPQATCALIHGSAWQLLVATILSAQSTDQTVNRVTGNLFAKYRSPADLASGALADLEREIHATGFFRQKARNIQAACRLIVENHGGEVPSTMDELLRLPGVARKTANVVLGTWFGRNDGVVVDTHVGRLAQRLKLTWRGRGSKDAARIEQDLMGIVPRKAWTYFSHALIWHGRQVCSARRPDCEECSLSKLCPSAFKTDDNSERRSSGSKARPGVRRSGSTGEEED
jgi:endonuclease-3